MRFRIVQGFGQVGIQYVSVDDVQIEFSVPPFTETNCNNGIDDDGDGSTDCADSDCCCAQAPTISKN